MPLSGADAGDAAERLDCVSTVRGRAECAAKDEEGATVTPKNILVTHDDEQNLTTWELAGAVVAFHPASDPNVRARQEADLLVHLVERLDVKERP